MSTSFEVDTEIDQQATTEGDPNESPSHEAVPPCMIEVNDDPDHPDHLKDGWQHYTNTLGMAISYGTCACFVLIPFGLVYGTVQGNILGLFFDLRFVIFQIFAGLFEVILYSLMIETFLATRSGGSVLSLWWAGGFRRFIRIGLRIVLPIGLAIAPPILLLPVIGASTGVFRVEVQLIPVFMLAFYVICALAYRILG